MTFTEFLRAIGILPRLESPESPTKRSFLKRLTPEQFLLVKEEYKKFQAKVEEEYNTHYEFHRKYELQADDKCPKCKSKNVNDRIQRLQGEFSGSISGSRSLFSGSLYGSSSGKIDTNEINKCNDCGNEWKKVTHSYTSTVEIAKNHFAYLRWLLEDYKKIMTAIVDKTDITEKYNSNQEKRDALLKELQNGYRFKEVKETFDGYSIEAIYEIGKEVYKASYSSFELDYFKEVWNVYFLEMYLNLKHIK